MTDKEKVLETKKYLSHYRFYFELAEVIEEKMTSLPSVRLDGVKSEIKTAREIKLINMIARRDKYLEQCDQIMNEINQVKELKYRQFLLCVFVQDMTYQKTADAMFYSLEHVKNNVSRKSYLAFYNQILANKSDLQLNN